MSEQAHIDCLAFARDSRKLESVIAVRDFTRLCKSLTDSSGEIRYRIETGLKKSGRAFMRLEASGQLQLQCQRCMQDMTLPIDNQFELMIVESETEADQLGEEIDVLLLDEQLISLSDLIEDEILLNLPIIPKHAAGTDCANNASKDVGAIAEQAITPADEAETNDKAKENPFAVLAELKNSKD